MSGMSASRTLFCLGLCLCIIASREAEFNGFNKGYTSVPVEEILSRSEVITDINLARNSITELQVDDFSRFFSARVIILSDNRISDIPNGVFCETNVSELYLIRTSLDSAPVLGCVGDRLTYLNLDYCQICYITSGTFDGMTSC